MDTKTGSLDMQGTHDLNNARKITFQENGTATGIKAMKTTISEMVGGEEVVIQHNQNLNDPHAFLMKLVLPGGIAYSTYQPDSISADSFTLLAPVSFVAPATATIYLLLFS